MIFSPQTIAFNGFSIVLGLINHWIQWFSMVMDHWSNNAMVSMGHSHLNSHKDWNFKVTDPAEEVNPGSGIILAFCRNLEWAGDSFCPSECCFTKWRQKHVVNTQSSKEKCHPLESMIHHPPPKTTFLLFASYMPTTTLQLWPPNPTPTTSPPYLFCLQACLWNAD